MNFIILTRSGNASPWILANSLKNQLESLGHVAEISIRINLLNRLVSYKNNTLNFHFWLKEILSNYLSDRALLKRIKKMDAVVICDCIPNGFWKGLYNVEKLRDIVNIPILFYEVYYLGNAPTIMTSLQKSNDLLLNRYDAHLYISPVTEIRSKNIANAFCIGLMARSWNLKPLPKKAIIAIVDFAQPGYEAYRTIQIEQLRKAEIQFIVLEKRYSIEEIRNIYSQASILFIQFPEAFGLPLLECLCSGAQIFTPDSGWPMSWRLDGNPKVHGTGILPNCFTVYDGRDDLLQKLLLFKKNFDPKNTPLKIFNEFIEHYPAFYHGNEGELKKCLNHIRESAN